MIDNLQLCVTAHISKYSYTDTRCSKWKSLLSWVSFNLPFKRGCLHRALLYIILYPSSFYSSANNRAVLLSNYFMASPSHVAGLSQNKYDEGKTALLKSCLSTIGLTFYVHIYDISTCVRNQQDYTLGLFEWVEEGFKVRMSVSDYMAAIFPAQLQGCMWNILHACEFMGWSQSHIRHCDTEGEGL